MKKTIFGAILAVCLSLFGGQVFAQCYQAPLILGSGPQGGSPCWGGQRQVIATQPVITQTFVPAGQAVASGAPCSWAGRAENVGGAAVIGAILGALATDNSRGAGKAAAVGGLIGTTLPCEQQRVVASGAQQVVALPAGEQGHTCSSGLNWKQLEWEGHPKHGQYLCLPSDEQIAKDKARSHNCPGNTSWKKLDWPRHPQNGMFACLPPDEEIARQKAGNNG